MYAVIGGVYSDIAARDKYIAVGFDALGARVIIQLRSSSRTSARHDIQRTAVHSKAAVRLYAVLGALYVYSAVIDGDRTFGDRIVLIGRGFESISGGYDIDSAAVYHNTAVACDTVVSRGNGECEAVAPVLTDSKCGFGSTLNAVLAVGSVGGKLACSGHRNGSAALDLDDRAVLIGICKRVLALDDDLGIRVLADGYRTLIGGSERKILEYQRYALAVLLNCDAAVLAAAGNNVCSGTCN